MGGVFASRWWIVFASACGLLVRTGSILVFSFGVFPEPVTEDPGISRGDVPTALGGATWRLMNRWGTRRILVPGVLALALAVPGFGLMQEEPRYLVFLILGTVGLVGGIQTPAAYAAGVSRWLDRDRGISLGMATAGVGLGVASILKLAAFLIKSAGMAVWFGAIGCCLGVAACLDVRARRGVRGCVRRPQRGDGYALGAASIEVRDRAPICKSLWLTKGRW
jgi:hypothetical protein